jgi:CRP/FNR family transcriptional regulator, cyclic AMP receptor protein
MTAARSAEPLRLASHPFFAGMEGGLPARLDSETVERSYEANEMLVQEGDPADRFVLLFEGKVALEVALLDRPRVTIQTLGGGEVLGWSWLTPPYYWRLDARAVKRTRTLEVRGDTLRAVLAAHPEDGYRFLIRLLPVVAERLENTQLQLLDLHGH